MDDEKIIELAPRIARMKNLRPYKGKTDEELAQIIIDKGSVPKKPKRAPQKRDDYDVKFNDKFNKLKKEFELDMNNSNDVEMLKNLVRHQIQLENIDKQIDTINRSEHPDFAKLKQLNDAQRNVLMSIKDLQDSTGISRKQRKEKANDDIPQWIDGVLGRAKSFYDTKTVKVTCPKDAIELVRYWVNFPKEKNEIQMSLTCWKCKEVIEYIG